MLTQGLKNVCEYDVDGTHTDQGALHLLPTTNLHLHEHRQMDTEGQLQKQCMPNVCACV